MKTNTASGIILAVTMGVIGLVCCGCQSTGSRSVPKDAIRFRKGYTQTPVVAVMDLENQAGGFGQWNLGNGMADMLVTRLMATRKVTVLERQYLRDVLSELSLQQQNAFRAEGRVAPGRLKNARYLIRGAVTEFAEVSGGSGGFGVGSFRIFGAGSRAIVALHLRIYDVETGEILSSIKAEGTAKAVKADAGSQYKDIKFGGEAFKRTPLGKATEDAITEAIEQLLDALPVDYWHPLVAERDGQAVVVNGGSNVGLRPGDQFIVREKPRFVTDPATGNVIDTITGKEQGRIQIQKVNALSSTATLLEGQAERGAVLQPLKK
jgi:curli biogenesis system outer membrane secretion channel CsgG